MKNNQPNDKEVIRLLKDLLDQEYLEKDILGKDLHSSKGILNTISRGTEILEINTDKSKFDLKPILEQKKLISDCYQSLQTIQDKLYSVTFNYSGILSGIKQYIIHYKKQYFIDHQKECPFIVYLDFDNNQNEKFHQIHDIRLYKSCTEILDYLFMCKPSAIKIKMSLRVRKLELEISAKIGKAKIRSVEITKRINLIKGKLAWGNAAIAKETNWKDEFRFTFNV